MFFVYYSEILRKRSQYGTLQSPRRLSLGRVPWITIFMASNKGEAMQRRLFDPDSLIASAWLMDDWSLRRLAIEIEEASLGMRRTVGVSIKPGPRARPFWVGVRLDSIERKIGEHGQTYWYCKGRLRLKPEATLPEYLLDSAYYDGCHVSLCVCAGEGGKIWRSAPMRLPAA